MGESIFTQVKAVVTPRMLCEHRGIPINREGKIHSPWHPPDTNPSLQVYDDNFCDYSDGKKRHDVIDYAATVDGVSPLQAAKNLAEEFNIEKSPDKEKKPRMSTWEWRLRNKYGDKLQAIYPYYSITDGKLCYVKLRFSKEGGGKVTPYGYVDEQGYFRFKLPEGKHAKDYDAVFGGIRAVRDAIARGQPVYYTEGEKDCQTVHSKISRAVVTCGSSGDWNKKVSSLFVGANLIILQDADQPGAELSQRIMKDLQGVVKTIRIIIPDQRKPGADISDYFQDHSPKDFFEELLREPEQAAGIQAVEPPKASKSDLVQKLIEMDAYHNYGTDDISSAKLFSDIFADVHRYNSTAKDWYFYNGKYWELDREGLRARRDAKALSKALTIYAVNCIPDTNEKTKEQYLKYTISWNYSRTRNTIIQDSRDLNFFRNEDLDKDIFALNVENGLLKFGLDGSMKFLPHSADDMCSKIAHVTYDKNARCKRWERFMQETMIGDNDKIRYQQKISGTCLTGDTSQEKMWMYYGSTSRNGKTTTLETLSLLLGSYATTIRPESLATKANPDSRNASPDIAKLSGIRLCITSEFPRRMNLDAGLLKSLTGNDRITARFLHQDEFEFYPQFKLICATNHLPICQDDSVFKSGRIQVVLFEKHFSEAEQDKHLKSELSKPESLSGILNWMIEGWKLFCAEGLEAPKSVADATKDYQDSNDKLQCFIDDTLAPAEGANISLKDLYAKYEDWCSQNGYRVENKQNFIGSLKNKGMAPVPRGMVNGKQTCNIIKNHCFIEDSESEFIQVDESEIPFS